MLALCKVTPGIDGIELREMPVREPGPGELKIRVHVSGVCGTDMHIYKWTPRMSGRMVLPRIMGHEVCGTVESSGGGVDHILPGQQVSLESHIYCGHCRPCQMDQAHLCESTQYPGIDVDGGFAEWIVVPARIAWVNPPGFSRRDAAMMEPLGIAVHACTEGTGVSGQTVLVNGCGPIGLMAVSVARALGAHRVFAVDINPIRLKAAAAAGADEVINPLEKDLQQSIQQSAPGGVDVAIEFSGSAPGLMASLQALRRGGDFRLVGAPSDPVAIDLTKWLRTGPTIRNIHGRRIWRNWLQAADLVTSRKIDLSAFVSHVLPLSEARTAFDLILKGQALKPLIAINE
jgi:threonine 3-dehydrogenase